MNYINCKLPYKYRLAYSYLCYRLNVEKSASRRQLAGLGLDRLTTLPTIVRRLERWKLVEDLGRMRGLRPLPPGDDAKSLFVLKSEPAGKWWRQFAYTPLPLRSPACPLTQVEHILYFVLRGLRPAQSYSGLAKLAGCSRWSAGRAVAGLAGRGLIKVAKRKSGFTLLERSEAPAEWWAKADQDTGVLSDAGASRAGKPDPTACGDAGPAPKLARAGKPKPAAAGKPGATWRDIYPDSEEGSPNEQSATAMLGCGMTVEQVKSLTSREVWEEIKLAPSSRPHRTGQEGTPRKPQKRRQPQLRRPGPPQAEGIRGRVRPAPQQAVG